MEDQIQLERYKEGNVYYLRKTDDHLLVLTAKNIRKEATGIHARLGVDLDGEELEFTVCNIERREERQRLSNSAHKFFGSSQEEADSVVSKGELLTLMTKFCASVWDTYLNVQSPEEMEGSTDISAVSYSLKPHVLTGGGTIMYGKPGKGKSFTGMMMALAVNYGVNHYWEPEQGKALFINLERPERTMIPRIGTISNALGLNSTSTLAVMNRRGSGLYEIHDALERYILENNVTFIVLDSISRSGTGDMKEDKVASRTVDMLNDLDVAWLAIGHTPKYDESTYYGSGQYEAGADVMLRHQSAVIDEEGSLAVLLEVTKANDMPIPRPMGLHYSFDENGLSAIRTATKDEIKPLLSGDVLLETSIKEYLGDTQAYSATQISKALDVERSLVTSVLTKLYRQQTIESVGMDGKERTYGLKYYGNSM